MNKANTTVGCWTFFSKNIRWHMYLFRYENYVDAETNETIEVKRQVYYDDSDLISPPDYCQDSFQEESNHELQVENNNLKNI